MTEEDWHYGEQRGDQGATEAGADEVAEREPNIAAGSELILHITIPMSPGLKGDHPHLQNSKCKSMH